MLQKLLHNTSDLIFICNICTFINTILPSRHWIATMCIKHFIFWLIFWLSIPTNWYISCCILFYLSCYYLVNICTKLQQCYSYTKSQLYWLYQVTPIRIATYYKIWTLILYSAVKCSRFIRLNICLPSFHTYFFTHLRAEDKLNLQKNYIFRYDVYTALKTAFLKTTIIYYYCIRLP